MSCSRPAVDLTAAADFLRLIDCEAEAFTFQTFDDRKDAPRRHLARVVHGPLQAQGHGLATLNADGAGVFFMVNAGDGNGRTASNVRAVRAVFADFDGASFPSAFELEPHVVVESSPGRFHVYWLASGVELTEFSDIQESIAARYGSDRQVKDLPRVMRIPGFIHQKEAPFVSRVVTYRVAPPYPAAELREAFPVNGDPAEGTRADGATEGEYVHEGQRNATLTREAGWMRRRKYSEGIILAALDAFNCERCRPLLPSPEVRAIARSVVKYPPGSRPDISAFSRPVDIFKDFAAPPYSADDVPVVVAQFADTFSRSTGFDMSAALLAAIAAAGAVIDDRYCLLVRPESDWLESARIWAALIGGPAAGKTPIIRAAMAPIKKMHKEFHASWYAANRDLPPDEREPEPCLFTSDTTLEALSEVLRVNPRGVLMLQEEFATWMGSMDAYRGGQGSRDRGEMLRLYDGGEHQINRVRRGTVFVENWGASVITAGTPAGLRTHVKQLPDDGLIHRFIVCIMRKPGNSGHAPFRGMANTWAEILRNQFYDTRMAIPLDKAHLTLSSRAVFEAEVERIHEATEDAESFCPALASHIGKHSGMLARLSLIFHLLGGDKGPEIKESTIDMASRFLRTARKHAATLFMDILQASSVRELARALGRSIAAAEDDPVTITRAWMSTHCRVFRDASDRERRAAVEFLEDANWIYPLADSRTYGGWPTGWAVNPDVAERFSNLGEEHRRRRANVRSIILGENT